ncbi:hypothetical protein MRB53_009113 [Persea americana]|uniref:Uncharacterized protein n=1 Tax=Persea americana TaxID=3435 RepID=A0ACC2LN52_PERAE|nr:hypothetical protein MRB53_009113 [Persea americana]
MGLGNGVLCYPKLNYPYQWNPHIRSSIRSSSSSSLQPPSLRYAVLGAGFAGLSVAWHLLKHSPKDARVCVDIYDELGIGGGASGVSGGLLHPYSPKAKLLWRGAECWKECQKLLNIAETIEHMRTSDLVDQDLANSSEGPLIQRRGILRPATDMKNADTLKENAQNCLGSCRIELIDKDGAQTLVPNLFVPSNSAVYMPQAVNINPKRYLQALFLACQDLVKESPRSRYEEEKVVHLHKKSITNLSELSGEYDAVIICLGAKAVMLPELSGKLPLRTCRGVVTHLQLPSDARGEYGDHSPSILSDAWLAVQGPRNVVMGSTWDWGSRNFSSSVSTEEASTALDELILKASTVYPCIRNWVFTRARAGVRAMPPLTPLGSLPLLGCVNDTISCQNVECRYWFVGGLGSRGLLYHGWLGKLTAQAVISCNEDFLPRELTSWKKLK